MTERPWFSETEVFLLNDIVIRLDRWARERVLDPVGLSYGEFVLMLAIDEMGQPTQGEAGERLDVSKSLVSQRVGSLLAKGFLLQIREADDRRQVRLELTAAGRKMLEPIYQQLAGDANRLFAVLGAERPRFQRSLARLREAIVAIEASLDGLAPRNAAPED